MMKLRTRLMKTSSNQQPCFKTHLRSICFCFFNRELIIGFEKAWFVGLLTQTALSISGIKGAFQRFKLMRQNYLFNSQNVFFFTTLMFNHISDNEQLIYQYNLDYNLIGSYGWKSERPCLVIFNSSPCYQRGVDWKAPDSMWLCLRFVSVNFKWLIADQECAAGIFYWCIQAAGQWGSEFSELKTFNIYEVISQSRFFSCPTTITHHQKMHSVYLSKYWNKSVLLQHKYCCTAKLDSMRLWIML